MTKTMNEQMEEIERAITEVLGNNCDDCDEVSICESCRLQLNPLQSRKSQLQTDMKIVEELKEKIAKEFRFTDLQCERLDKLFKESVGRL